MHKSVVRNFCERTVHIPFDIGNIARRKQIIKKLLYKGDDIGIGKVEHLLMAGKRSFMLGTGNGKFGMLFSQLADRVDHFGLYPDTEFQPHLIDLFCQS